MSAGSSKVAPKKSVSRVQDDCEEEWENHTLLRFPAEVAKTVEQIVTEDSHANERLAINFESNMRHGSIRVDSRLFSFKVYDLPCVTEVMKTVDKKTLYKVTDLSQMLLCSMNTFPNREAARARRWSGSSTSSGGESASGVKSKKEFQWPHGLAPPMKNARKRRFRKTKKKKYMDAPDVERELKRLLRSDLDAHSIRWEVVPIEQKDRVNSQSNESHQNVQKLTQEKIAHLLDSLSDSGNEVINGE